MLSDFELYPRWVPLIDKKKISSGTQGITRNREPDLFRFLVLFRLCLKVSLWTGDALSLCANGFPPDLAFDIIDTSNVCDHIGLLNVLVCCAPRLKE